LNFEFSISSFTVLISGNAHKNYLSLPEKVIPENNNTIQPRREIKDIVSDLQSMNLSN
jgi:hypothetical protein